MNKCQLETIRHLLSTMQRKTEKRQLLLKAASELPSYKMTKEEFVKWLEEEY